MRRIIRIERPLRAYTSHFCLCSQCSFPTRLLRAQAQTRTQSTSPQALSNDSLPDQLAKGMSPSSSNSDGPYSAGAPPTKPNDQQIPPFNDVQDPSNSPQPTTKRPTNVPEFYTELQYPPAKPVRAARLEEVIDQDYAPAESGAKLEVVGGLDSWWESDGRWPESLRYKGFGPQAKVTDPAILQVLVRRALVEALAVYQLAQVSGTTLQASITKTWELGARTELMKTLSIGLALREDGSVALEGEVSGVLSSLRKDGFSRAQKTKTPIDEPVERDAAEAGEDKFQGSGADLAMGAPGEVSNASQMSETSNGAEVEAVAMGDGPALSAHEARELLKSWDKSWKMIPLDEPALKFAVTKRVRQLTGHLISDNKFDSISKVSDLIAIVITPPRSKSLLEEIEKKREQFDIPNLKVYSRRVTPIDKEIMIGRWKVMVQELEKRGLPVVGTGDYDKSVEKRWALGKS